MAESMEELLDTTVELSILPSKDLEELGFGLDSILDRSTLSPGESSCKPRRNFPTQEICFAEQWVTVA